MFRSLRKFIAEAVTWRGRIGRLGFGAYLLHEVFWLAVIVTVALLFKPEPGTLADTAVNGFLRLAFLCCLFANIGLWCAAIKRFHDLGMRGWWSLSLFAVAPLVFLMLQLAPGMKEANRFGASGSSPSDSGGGLPAQ